MDRSLRFNFSRLFEGVIWNTLAVAEKDLLLLEIRDAEKKQVKFSALNFAKNEFLWADKSLEESWWVNLSAVSDGVILYTLYTETNNPDKKALLAFRLQEHKMIWWNNDFSLISVIQDRVLGYVSKLSRETVLELQSGKPLNVGVHDAPAPKSDLLRPFQYNDQTGHFATVQTFLRSKLNLSPIIALEYLEYESLIFISYNVTENGLVNYLLVLDGSGAVLLHEKLDEPQKGIGLDTFFILNGCLFFVKNRRELVSYFIV
ncbi:MAG TPA: DUF4905 domain-containing protein [Ohtaekwangia sp.]